MISDRSRHGVREIGIINRVFRISAKVMHAMTELRQKSL
jgi:hypothetical protein